MAWTAPTVRCRNAQFEYINRLVIAFQKQQQPVISVDTKKKELVGEFKNPGAEWHPKGQPKEVNVHDFPDPKMGKAIPYGVYDLACNEGWVSVGIDHDTAEFACASIGRWWQEMGAVRFPRVDIRSPPTKNRKSHRQHTRTKTGLTVRAALDQRQYETGIAVSDEELNQLNITRPKFHGEWNYSIKPRSRNL